MILVDVQFDVRDIPRFEVLEQKKRKYTWELDAVGSVDFTLPPGAKVWEFHVVSPTPQLLDAELLVSSDGMTYRTLAEYSVDSPAVSVEPSAFQSVDSAVYFRLAVSNTVDTKLHLVATL